MICKYIRRETYGGLERTMFPMRIGASMRRGSFTPVERKGLTLLRLRITTI